MWSLFSVHRAWTVRWSRGTVTDLMALVLEVTTKPTLKNRNLSTVRPAIFNVKAKIHPLGQFSRSYPVYQVRNKLATSPSTGKLYGETCLMDFRHNRNDCVVLFGYTYI